MNIKEINEVLSKVLNENSVESLIDNRYSNLYRDCTKIEEEGITLYDFNFIGLSELSDDAFERLLPNIEEINGVEKDLGNGIVFYSSGDNLGSIEDGYIDLTIEIKDGVELTPEILDEFDKFMNDLYRKYIKLAGYKNTDGDMYDIAPIQVDFVVEQAKDDVDEDILAVFPEISEGYNRCQCYRHIGQHGVTDVDYYKGLNKATKEQYINLYNELTGRGYNLNVLNADF